VFRKSFGVRADFRSDTPRTAEAERTFARVAAAVSRKAGLPPVDADGLAALVETAAELAGRRDRLTDELRRRRAGAAGGGVPGASTRRRHHRAAGRGGRPAGAGATGRPRPDPGAVSRLLPSTTSASAGC
jgi:hypothetical protein